MVLDLAVVKNRDANFRSNTPTAGDRHNQGSGAGGKRATPRAVSKWDAPPADKWSEDKGWQEVNAKGSKTPAARDNRGGFDDLRGARSAPSTPTGRRDDGRGAGRGGGWGNGRGGKGDRGGRGGKGRGGKGRGGNDSRDSKGGEWRSEQKEMEEVGDDGVEYLEPEFETNSWQSTLQGFWSSSGELGQVVGMGTHRHWTGKVNFTADGKFWMIKVDHGKSKSKRKQVCA